MDFCSVNISHLEAVVANDAEDGDDSVDDTEESHGRLHVACALFQEVVHGTFFFLIFTSVIKSGPILLSTGSFKHAGAFKQCRTLNLLLTTRCVGHLEMSDNNKL